ncbi:MAG TPA: hypothetical protein PLZ45_00410 [Ferruginibacter sp.]|nr:hypothetical protein [Ferruginibacter sp.]
MTRSKKKILIATGGLLLLTLITAGFVGYRMYTKPHRDVQHIRPVRIAAMHLVAAYEANEANANRDYLDKVLEVSGYVTDVSKNQEGKTVVSLDGTGMGTVRCTMEGIVQHEIKPKTQVSIKGICTGYLTDVILVRCMIQEK